MAVETQGGLWPAGLGLRSAHAKGLLVIGIPGTGKSLTAKATAGIFGLPLLKLDAGRIFGGLEGQSAGNLRSVIQTAEAIAPCVLWVDELEKSFAGSKSSNATDGGTSAVSWGVRMNIREDAPATLQGRELQEAHLESLKTGGTCPAIGCRSLECARGDCRNGNSGAIETMEVVASGRSAAASLKVAVWRLVI